MVDEGRFALVKPIFVVGAPRSGTTLARSLLCSVRQVYLLPDEFQILATFVGMARAGLPTAKRLQFLAGTAFAYNLQQRNLWPSREAFERILGAAGAAESFRRLVVEVAALEGRAEDVEYWGDKTPGNLHHLHLIYELWPDARIVNVVRDPRDVVLSMRAAWGRSVELGAIEWRQSIARVQDAVVDLPALNMLTTRYENLTRNPLEELSRIVTWLGIETDMSEVPVNDLRTGERWGRSVSRRGVASDVSRWRTHVSPAAVSLIEEICYAQMVAVGYSPQYADAPVEPSDQKLRLLRYVDRLSGVRAYAQERGWRRAISYRWRQRKGRRWSG